MTKNIAHAAVNAPRTDKNSVLFCNLTAVTMERRMKRNISQQELDAFFATMDKIMHNLDGDGEAGPENGGKLRKN